MNNTMAYGTRNLTYYAKNGWHSDDFQLWSPVTWELVFAKMCYPYRHTGLPTYATGATTRRVLVFVAFLVTSLGRLGGYLGVTN